MSSICSRCGAAALAAGLLATACTVTPPPDHPRPALPLPPELQARYRLPGPVEEIAVVPIGGDDETSIQRGLLSCGNEVADFHWIRHRGVRNEPFVLCLPILAGGQELMWIVATSLAERGYSVAWTSRVASALRSGQRGPELEQLLRRTVIHNRMMLAWARRQDGVDPARMACVGISAGSLVATVLMAVEPRLRAGALCLAGGDLPRLLAVSDETRAVRWRNWRRRADGLSVPMVTEELSRDIRTDPALFGPYIDTREVILVGASLDEVVPPPSQDLLWESLGRPERKLLPLGHFTSALGFGSIFGAIDDFLRPRLLVD